MKNFRLVNKVAELPSEWDELAENYFCRTGFLSHAEKYNPCRQRYYLYFENEKLLSAAIVYTLQLDLLTYIKIKSPLRMNIAGIPCSVSGSGIFGNSLAVSELKKHIYENEKGFVLLLNLADKPENGDYATGNTLPTMLLENHFDSWEDYIAMLRSDYRRRLKKITANEEGLYFGKKECAEFTEEMYRLYLEVYRRSSGKLEKLGFDFFKNLPSDFKLNCCYKNGKVAGWTISLADKDVFYFFLGGIDYTENKANNTYFRLLAAVARDGIGQKAKTIELGQTAEIPKMRLGAKASPRYMEAHHSNRFFNFLLKKFSHFLVYKRKLENNHVLKEANL